MSDCYAAWKVDWLDPSKVSREDVLKNICHWGTLAPSVFNSQPWFFVVKPSESIIDLYVVKDQNQGHLDRVGRQTHVSMGCCIENMCWAGRYYGLETAIDYNTAGPNKPFARMSFSLQSENVSWHKDSDADFFMRYCFRNVPLSYRSMSTRRTNRGPFDSLRPVPEEVSKAIKFAAEEFGLGYNLLNDTGLIKILAGLDYLAARAKMWCGNCRNSLSNYVIPNIAPGSHSLGYGMPGDTFGLSDARALALHETLATHKADKKTLRDFVLSEYHALTSTPYVGILSVKSGWTDEWVKCGRCLERIALLAETNGLAMSVHSSIPESVFPKFFVMARLPILGVPTAVFRLGYAKESFPHSPRRSNHRSLVVEKSNK